MENLSAAALLKRTSQSGKVNWNSHPAFSTVIFIRLLSSAATHPHSSHQLSHGNHHAHRTALLNCSPSLWNHHHLISVVRAINTTVLIPKGKYSNTCSHFIHKCAAIMKLYSRKYSITSSHDSPVMPFCNLKTNDLDQLLVELKRVFSPTQNSAQIQTDLARVRQKPQEKVSEYGLRVTQILQKARELINENFSPIVALGIMKGTTNTAIKCFTLGLESDIATQMIGKRLTTIEAVVSTAITCERHVQQRKEMHGDKLEDSRKSA